MPSQRHPVQSDILMFVTTNTLRRRRIFSHAAYASEAIDLLYRIQNLHPFLLFGFVIMPDHVHLLLNIPHPYSIATLMNAFKSGLTFDLGIGPLWQKRYDLRVPENGHSVLRYIHYNPVQAGLALSAQAYPWSSASGRYDVSMLP
ncbi:MAG: transposase [Candidatus Peribacteraceae bacterium]